MDIRNFITFNKIVEIGNFTKAAEALNYAQSTVTLHIKELEKHYNTKLFDRINKKNYLTTFGKQLHKKSLEIVKDYEVLLDLNEDESPLVVLRIGVFESLLRYRLYPLLQEFKGQHPSVDLVIQHGVCTDLRKQVQMGELDLTFQIEPIRDFADLRVKVLCQEDFQLILPKNRSLDMLHEKEQTVYLTEKNCSYRGYFERYLDSQGVVRKSVMETGSVDMIKQYVGLGMGYSMLPSIVLKGKQDQEALELYDLTFERPLYAQLVYHKNKYVFEAMQDFMDLVEKYAVKWRDSDLNAFK